jgi:hypothetical protein
MLGAHAVATICGEARPKDEADLPELFACACKYLGREVESGAKELAVELKEAAANAA